jgi:hypothetical protein
MAKLNHETGILVHLAETGTPADSATEGANFLHSVQDDVNEYDMDDGFDVIEAADEIALACRGDHGGFNDTAQMWQAWTDLQGWTEYAGADQQALRFGEIDQVAHRALGAIAYRLAQKLFLERIHGPGGSN